MSRMTSYAELYTTLGALVTKATGRPWWNKTKMQVRPKTPYAVVYLQEDEGQEKQVVETIELDTPLETGEVFQQIPWSTVLLKVRFEFYSSRTNDTALQAATRARSALYLEERFWDLWDVCALSGGVRLIDLSEMFREDVEQRVELHFRVWANVADPLPLEDANIFDIDSQQVDVAHVKIDDQETEITVNVENNSESS